MLLLFWRSLGIAVGEIHNIRWQHTATSPPRYLCGADEGLTIINPYLDTGEIPECSYFMTPTKVTCSCIFENNILAGTVSGGVYMLSWDIVEESGCFAENPPNLSSNVSLSYTTASGLPSDDIISIDSFDPYLAILTSSGLYWK